MVVPETIVPEFNSVTKLIEEQALLAPTSVAIACEERELSYAKLIAATRSFACKVVASGAHSEQLVGIYMPRGLEMVAALFGIMAAGAAYLPLDLDLPEARLRQIVEEAQPVLLVTLAACAQDLAGFGLPLLILPEIGDDPGVVPSNFVLPTIGPQSLAYVVYTSGSTGRPKGVEVTHGAIANVLASYRDAPGMHSEDVALALARISFDVSVLELFLPLSCGARVVLLPQNVARDPFALARTIERYGVTVIQGPPALWRSLLQIGWRGSRRLRIWSGGDVLARALADELLPLCRELWNAYGPTETTIVSTIHRVAAGSGDVPIGRAIAQTRLLVLDEALQPCSRGRTGELWIGGAGLARGYRGRPDLTAERFQVLGDLSRLYRTGDLVRRARSGELHFVGRTDSQIKLRGFRVELGEVEEVLASQASVSSCVVRAWPDAAQQSALVAYVVLRAECAQDAAAFRTHVRTLLPDYMTPQRFVFVETLPLTSNGKVDRSALSNPFNDASEDRPQPGEQTAASVLHTLGAIWLALLGPLPLGPESDFFDLGGYSLLTVRLLLEIEEQFGRSLSMPELLCHSILRSMATLIEDGVANSGSRRLTVIQPEGSQPPLYWLDAGPLLRKTLRSIGGDRPVFGLNLAPEDERTLLETGFDTARLASVIVGLITDVVTSDEAFCLGGWCRWGMVAYEAARQLRDLGYRCCVVVLLDTDLPVAAPLWRGWRKRLSFHSGGRAPHTLGGRRLRPSFSDMVALETAKAGFGAYAGAVALIQPEQRRGAARAALHWRALVEGPLTLHHSPGDHETMVREPFCATLGGVIGAAVRPQRGGGYGANPYREAASAKRISSSLSGTPSVHCYNDGLAQPAVSSGDHDHGLLFVTRGR